MADRKKIVLTVRRDRKLSFLSKSSSIEEKFRLLESRVRSFVSKESVFARLGGVSFFVVRQFSLRVRRVDLVKVNQGRFFAENAFG